MSFRTQRLYHWPTQQNYEYGQRWPGTSQTDPATGKPLDDKDPNLQLVGPMFLRPRTIETVEVPGKPPDLDRGFAGEDPDDFEEESPECWEIWCLTTYVFVAYFGHTASQVLGGEFKVEKEQLFEMMRNMRVTRRRIFMQGEMFVDDEWPAHEAMEEISKRMLEIEGGDDIDEAAEKIESGDDLLDDGPVDDQAPVPAPTPVQAQQPVPEAQPQQQT